MQTNTELMGRAVCALQFGPLLVWFLFRLSQEAEGARNTSLLNLLFPFLGCCSVEFIKPSETAAYGKLRHHLPPQYIGNH